MLCFSLSLFILPLFLQLLLLALRQVYFFAVILFFAQFYSLRGFQAKKLGQTPVIQVSVRFAYNLLCVLSEAVFFFILIIFGIEILVACFDIIQVAVRLKFVLFGFNNCNRNI